MNLFVVAAVHHNQVAGVLYLILFLFPKIQKFYLNSVEKGVKAVNINT